MGHRQIIFIESMRYIEQILKLIVELQYAIRQRACVHY